MFFINKIKFTILIISIFLALFYIFPYILAENFSGDFRIYSKDFIAFSQSPHLIWPEFGVESGFYLLGYLFSRLLLNYYFYIFFIALLFYFFSGLLFLKELRNKENSLIIYIMMLFFFPLFFAYDSLLNVTIRQGVAVIILWKFYFPIYDRGLKSCILIICLACFFHISAILYFFIYYILRLFKNEKYYILFYLISSILYIFEIPIIFAELLRNTLEKVFFFKLDLAIFSYKEHIKLGFSVLKFLVIIIPFIGYVIFRKSSILQNSDTKKIWNVYLIICSIGMLMSGLPYHDRIMLYGWSWIPLLAIPFLEIIYINFRKRKNVS